MRKEMAVSSTYLPSKNMAMLALTILVKNLTLARCASTTCVEGVDQVY